MAKKKSKSQKQKQSIKRKIKEQEKKSKQLVSNKDVKYNVVLTEPDKYKKKKTTDAKKEAPKANKKGKVVKNTDVIYNVALNKKNTKKKETKKVVAKKSEPTRKPVEKKKFSLKEFINSIKEKNKAKKIAKEKEKVNKKGSSFDLYSIFKPNEVKPKKKKVSKNYVVKKEVVKNKKGPKSNNYVIQPKKPKNLFLRILYYIYSNLNVFFDTILILTFVLFVIGLIKINVFEQKMIIYICGLVIFLMVVAISYNRHIEGWIFTLLLCGGMGFAIYQMNYTYDFINALNTKEYEMKTYYIVTFDNPTNINLYNVSNKKVGILKDDSVRVERYLNTKIKTNYIEYDDVNSMFEDFYAQRLRAVIVRDNQYKYLENNVENNRSVKILHDFEVNGKK